MVDKENGLGNNIHKSDKALTPEAEKDELNSPVTQKA